jgi:hypothetical protein
MKKKTLALSCAFAFLFSSITGLLLINSVTGDGGIVNFPSVPQIKIYADGTITPQTEQITRSGATYTLTDNLDGTQIVIECSNIIFDGNGYSITLMNSGSNPGIHISYSTNTTIKNMQVKTPLYTGILMHDCSDCHITGIKSSGFIELRQSSHNVMCENTSPLFLKSDYNQIFRNNITGLALWAGSNTFYQNNILLDSGYIPYADEANFWDNSSIGNYWSDYATRYPDASEVGQTGIGDTPYVLNADNIDHYPAMYPFNMENGAIAVPNREPAPQLFSFPFSVVVFALGGFVAFIIAVVAGLVYHRSHSKVSFEKRRYEK